MKTVIQFFSTLDRHVQKAFDATMFAIMRTLGVGKGFIRYGFFAAILAVLTLTIALPKNASGFDLFDKTLRVFTAIVMLRSMRQCVRADQIAEERGMRSTSDLVTTVPLLKPVLWGMTVIGLVVAMSNAHDPEAHRIQTLGFALDDGVTTLMLALLYLAKMPDTPPTQKTRDTITTPAESSA